MTNQGSNNNTDKVYQKCKGGLIIASIDDRSFKYCKRKLKKNPHDKFENKQKLPFPRKYNLPKHTEDTENLKRCLMIKDGQPVDNNLPFKNKQKNQ